MDDTTLDRLADIVCSSPVYRKGWELSEFFARAGLPRFVHDGSSRRSWALSCLRSCSDEELNLVIARLASPKEYGGDRKLIASALEALNEILEVEGLIVSIDGITPKIDKRKEAPDYSRPPEKELEPMPPPDFFALRLEAGIGELLNRRWEEAQRCVDVSAHLAATIMMGSLLEGMLLGVMNRFPGVANQAKAAPKIPNSDTTKKFWEWYLSEMIDVAHEVGWIDLDVKKFSHSLREFRNLIHPYHQLATKTNPDSDTCRIGWLVVQAAVNDLAKVLESDGA